MHERVLIVGAGIAGHTLACALANQGIKFDIVELKKDWNILGAGMYVQNNALRGFAEIGVADAIVEAGWHSPTNVALVADVNGTVLARTTVPECPGSSFPGFVPISRPVLHKILSAALLSAGGKIRMGTTVETLTQTDGAVDVTFTDGTSGTYGLVVAADGINSAIRGFVFPEVKPVYTGFANWRAILPMEEPRQHTLWQIGPETSFGIIPISDTHLYVGTVSKEPDNPWFERDELLSLMQKRYAMFGGPAREMLNRITSSDQITYTPVHEVIMPRPWSKGRVVIVGDAAHASTPFWAQGASMAVEDVVLLARMLGEGGEQLDVLRNWEDRRHARCVFVQEGSKNTGVHGHAAGEAALLATYAHIQKNAQQDVTRRYERLNQPI